MKKKITSSIILLVLLVSLFPLKAQAASGSLIGVKLAVSVGVNIYINDVPFTPTDVNGNEVKPFIYNGTTYLPARAISNVFGAKIDWNGDTQSVYIDTSTVGAVTNHTPYRFDTVQTNTTISAEKGVKIYVNNVLFTPTDVNGKAVAAYTVNGTTYLPVRAIASVFKTAIVWESSNSGVYIGTHTAIVSPNIQYGLPGDANYKVPSENDSQEELAARFFALYEQWSKNRVLIKAKRLELSNVVSDNVYQYNEYDDYVTKGNSAAQDYVNKFEAICDELTMISNKMEENFDPDFNSVYSVLTEDNNKLKNDKNSLEKDLLVVGVNNLGLYVKSTSTDLASFTPAIEQQFRNRFQALYAEFVKEVKNQA